MTATSWTTKEDVLQDLGVIGQGRISDDDLVVRNGPPPTRRELLDDEFDLRFGGTTYSDVTVKPDLKGITQYLRMLSDDDDSDEEETIKESSGGIVISKLNPLVKEFVPRSSSSNSQPNEAKSVHSDNVRKSPSKPTWNPLKSPRKSPKRPDSSLKFSKGVKNVSKHSVESADGFIEPQKQSVTSPTKSIQPINQKACSESDEDMNKDPKAMDMDIVEKTNELRNKISDSLKSDLPIHKKERNVAIANLLKLHSAKPSPSTSKSNISTEETEKKELKLFTPDYFKRTSKDIPSSSSSSKKLENDEKPMSIETNDNCDNTKSIVNKIVENSKNPEGAEKNENGVEKAEINENIDTSNAVPTSVDESIKKVNNWLEKSRSPQPTSSLKTPAVCMGPISFKRKGVNVKSPSEDVDKAKSKTPVAQFKPSKYADDLAKKYMERNQENERREMSIWENLEKELKKKDEVIKKKQAANRHV